MSRCYGCGVKLQTENKEMLGYVPLEKYAKKALCERCFRLIHYNDYKLVDLPKKDILNKINKDDFVFFIVDLLNINNETLSTYKSIKGIKILIISKVDYIPKYLKIEKIKNWLREEYQIKDEIIFISALKRKNINLLLEIMNAKNKSHALLLGYTNSGKSTLINSLLKNDKITTSIIPNTTIDCIKIKIDENKFLIDTPGLLYQDNSIYQDKNLLKKINPKNSIKPITYQLKANCSIIIEDYIRILNVGEKSNFTIYMSNLLDIKKVYSKNELLLNLDKKNIKVKKKEDLVIKNFGFISFNNDSDLVIYIKNKDNLEIRKSFFER